MSQSGSNWLQVVSPNRDHAQVRLFCLPHGGGGVSAYRGWAEILPEWVEVVAVALPGRGARFREPAATDMADLCSALADAIAVTADQQPYAIFGHSVGALVAFETAMELQQRRAPAPLRVFLSSYAAPSSPTSTETFHQRSDAELLGFLGKLGHDALQEQMDDELRQHMLSAVRADFKLSETHRVAGDARLRAPMTVLGGQEDATVPHMALQGWRDHSGGQVECHLLPGDHFYTETARNELGSLIADTLHQDLENLPRSLAFGANEPFPLDKCLHELFREQVARTPNECALVGPGRELKFAQLDRESDLLARRLVHMGCGPDRLVAILMPTSVNFVIAYLAALKAGGAYLPIPVATPDAAIADILAEAAPVAIVTCEVNFARLPGSWQSDGRAIAMNTKWQETTEIAGLGNLATAEQPTADNLAYCVMTSGTTGKPKGIICPHRGAVNSYWWRYSHLPYEASEREACNVFFVWEVLRPLLQGKSAYIIPDDVIFDPRRLIDFLGTNRITRVLFTPSLLDQVLDVGGQQLSQTLPELRVVILNGEVVTTALARRFKALLPHVQLINDYSISECHDVATLNATTAIEQTAGRYLPVGQPMSNVNVYVLDDDLHPVPKGVAGEVWVGGESLARGYLNQSELTATRFVPDPFVDETEPTPRTPRMFRTGDVGRLRPDGTIEITGRSNFMVKLRGYSVVPSAIEAEIRAHECCSSALVVTVDNPETGQPERLVAYVAGQGGRRPNPAAINALRGHLKKRLPQYAIPSAFVPLSALPIDPATGKVDRKNLPPPQRATPAPFSDASQAAPNTLQRVMSLWQQALAVPTITAEDNFFDLGGHSLLAAEMTRATEAEFGIDLSVIDVFDHPVAADYATHVIATATRTGRAPGRNVSHESNAAQSQRGKASGGQSDIAVVGMACRFPGAKSVDELWQLVLDGRSSVRRFTDDELRARGVPLKLLTDPEYVKAGAILDDVADFDPRFWGLSEAEATLMDPQQRLFLECCWHALESSGHKPSDVDGNIGVFAGAYLPSYLINHLGAQDHLDAADPTRFHLAELGNDKDYLASRVAYLMNLTGPAIGVQTSCSTGLVAIAQAAAALRDGQCDMVLAGASSITFPQGGFLSVDGHIGTKSGICRAFDAAADGTILGDGVGVVVLRRLSEALADGDNVLAVIKGCAINNDGAAKAGYSAPSASGQSAVIARALDMAGVGADTIGYVEAHGTGTRLGDPIEVRGLTDAYRQQTQARGYCALGSVKPNIGHSNIAAGVAGFIKAVMAVRDGVIPPLANYKHANPELNLPQTPFRIPTALEPWPSHLDSPRRAGISSFGIGGTNCHIVIEASPAEPHADNDIAMPVVLPLSVKKPQALRALAGAISGAVRETPHPPLPDIAATLQSGRTEFPYRIAVAARTGKEASLGLLTRAGNLPTQPAGELTKGRIVFVIPGHGSQYVAMGAGLYATHPTFRRHFDDCAKAFDRAGHELRPPKIGEVSVSDPVALQSAIFSLGIALCKTLMDWGVKPSAVCGHSLGEYAAATIAGVLTLDDAACLVVARAQGTAVAEPGGMLSLAAPETVARQLMGDVRGLSLAALNSPNDTVVSGALDSIAAAELWCERNVVAARRLPVRNAFHSPMMSTAGERLEEAAAGVSMHPPTIPLVSNLTGRLWTADETADPDYWIKQLLSPVRFSAGISTLTSSEPSILLEAGPGRTLQRALVRSAAVTVENEARSPVVCALGSARGDATLEPFALAETIAELWQSGTDIDWEKYREGAPFRRVALPAYPFTRMKCWPADDLAQRAISSTLQAPPEARLKWEDIFHLPSWARTPAPSSIHAWQGEFIVLAPRGGRAGQFADSLCTILEAKTSRVVRIDAGPEPHAHHLAMSGALRQMRDSDGQVRLIDLTCLGCEVRTFTNAIDMTNMLSNGFARLAEITGGKQVETWLILDGALQVMDEGSQPLVAPLLSPVITAAQEHPQIATRLIDVRLGTVGSTGDEKQLAAQIAAEVSSVAPRSEPLLALRGGHGWVERFEPLPICQADRQAGAERLQRAGGPHIITGGLGRIGRELARRLANLGCQVVLVSRKPAPHPDWLNENFADASARVEIRKCDVSNERDVRQLLFSLAASHGGIGGIFHAAGVADLRYLEQTSSETIAAECAPKIAGLENLCKAIEDLGAQTGRRPDFAMLFSSMAAVLGGLGMTGYMAANRYMDARVAKTPSIAGVPLVSVNFDDWDFDYSKEQVAAYAHTRKGLSLSPEEGLAAIEAILGWPTLRQVVLSATPIEQRIAKWMKRQPGIGPPVAHKTPPPSAAKVLENLEKQLIGGDPIADLVLKAYAKVIGAVGLAPDADFFELGGDSLLAAQLALELRKSMPQDTNLTIGDIFDHPTPLQLAARLAECSNGGIPDEHDFATIN